MKLLLSDLRSLRTERGLTLREVAERVGTSESYVSMIERGVRKPSPEMATLIGKALGLTEEHALALGGACPHCCGTGRTP